MGEKPPAVCKLNKGEAIVFDYDGGFSKRKDLQAKEFPGGAVNLSPPKNEKEGKGKSVSQMVLPKKG